MSEREQSPAGAAGGTGDWREQTTPGIEPVRGGPADPGYGPGPSTPAGYGSAAAGSGAAGFGGAGATTTAPAYSTRPVPVRRPDTFASLLLILAGIAAAVSLLLQWLPGSDRNGLDLVRRGFDELENGFGELLGSGFWQPMAVILGGGVLFVLGLLLVLPARTHRFLGVLALLVSLVAAAGVLVPLAGTGWDLDAIDTGFWFAAAVPALGLLGALKALLTGPRSGR
ncbi:hypothetical protein [Geodermatophilus sp. CPCC 206100]|uniref:hypothetical protein n=1 Tax=Geodermatophilus sp. CPCC 206100 TaxID=3020054 RepID=UPI003AFFE5E0